jgi:hypothetical protein
MPREMSVPNQAATKTRTAGLPAPDKGSFNPFLKPGALGKSRKGTVKIIGVRDAPADSFSDIVVEVTIGKKKYDWGMRFSSGNYRRLHDEFGKNPAKWKGSVQVGVKEYIGKEYVAAE